MSDYGKGDRVRIVIEGDVQEDPEHNGGFLVGLEYLNYIVPSESHIVSVEKIAPALPTTPGSVIRQGHDRLAIRILGQDGIWRATWSNHEADADFMRRHGYRYEVIFDAGAKP